MCASHHGVRLCARIQQITTESDSAREYGRQITTESDSAREYGRQITTQSDSAREYDRQISEITTESDASVDRTPENQ